MKYMGSKARIAKHILPIILKARKEGQCYVEPFVGGANMIDKVNGWRIGADSNYWLICALNALADGWNPPELVTEDEYLRIKHDNSSYKPELVGYVGFQMSFGGKWFGGYRRDVKGTRGCIENMKTQSRRSRESALRQAKKINGVKFYNCSYLDLLPPSNSIICCDPPYANTTKYKDDFDNEQFWQWCRDKVKEGHQVFISEYNAPDDFVCV